MKAVAHELQVPVAMGLLIRFPTREVIHQRGAGVAGDEPDEVHVVAEPGEVVLRGGIGRVIGLEDDAGAERGEALVEFAEVGGELVGRDAGGGIGVVAANGDDGEVRAEDGRFLGEPGQQAAGGVAAEASIEALVESAVSVAEGDFQDVQPMHAGQEPLGVGRAVGEEAGLRAGREFGADGFEHCFWMHGVPERSAGGGREESEIFCCGNLTTQIARPSLPCSEYYGENQADHCRKEMKHMEAAANTRSSTDQFRETAARVKDDIRELGTVAKEAATDKFESWYQEGRDQVVKLEQGMENTIREHPLKAVTIAAGVGVLVGFLISRRR